eukprot:6109254-Prymnesium_polylepis.1
MPGKPQAHAEENIDAGTPAVPRKCPSILNWYLRGQPVVDSANRGRQEILAIEEAFRTDSFPFRFFISLLGVVFINTHRASMYFHNDQRDTKAYCQALFYSLMTNTIDEGNGSNAPPGSGAPGALSPDKG